MSEITKEIAQLTGYGVYILDKDRRVVADITGEGSHILGDKIDSDVATSKEKELSDGRIIYLEDKENLGSDYINEVLGVEEIFKREVNHLIQNSKVSTENIAIFKINIDDLVLTANLTKRSKEGILREIRLRIRESLRSTDILIRSSEEQYIIIFPGMSKTDDYELIVEKIGRSLDTPITINDKEIYFTASTGIAFYPEDGKCPSVLLEKSNHALLKSIETGGGKCNVYGNDLKVEFAKRLEIKNQLKRALNNNEISVNYQPQVDITTGKIVGLEALARWHNKELGNIPPNEFIPLAEETGLIHKIGEWVLYRACMQNKMWQDMGLPEVKVAVNVSHIQFRNSKIVRVIKKALQETGLDSKWLEVEITESGIMRDEVQLKVLDEIKAIGVSLSIDDFGTEYSSLSHLHKIPADGLKIDRSFILDISNKGSRAISTSIINLATSFDMSVIAEGVETEEQREFLRENGCNLVQGYLYSRPLDEKGVTKMLMDEMKGQSEVE